MESVSKVSSTLAFRSANSGIPRLSILVPLDQKTAAFEETLISVLENRPEASEILVCHDGRYDDPFDLCDEVRFVNAASSGIVDLVSAGAGEANGRFVHVLGSGFKATAGWADAAIEKFEHFDCGSIASVVRNQESGRIVAAGWQDSSDRLCKASCQGMHEASKSSAKLVGAYLQASFWRRDLLLSLTDAFKTTEMTEASVAYEYLARQAGWRCVVAEESDLVCDKTFMDSDKPSVSRGRVLRSLRNHFHHGGPSTAIQGALLATLSNIARPSLLSESIGQAFAAFGSGSLRSRVNSRDVVRCDGQDTVVPFNDQREQSPVRRAA